MNELIQHLWELQHQTTGYVFPNEVEIQWSILIVVYPYVTGLVAGAFILAALVKLFKIEAVKPLYRPAMLTALAFMIVAPLPLLMHLGKPFRFYELVITPNPTSAMAMFGFVYAWYLAVVLLLEIWFDYRRDLIVWGRTRKAPLSWLYKALSLFSKDISDKALKFDKKAVHIITVIGVPSAFLLHGYVGFIFGSIKANPWWSSVLMPIVFLFSAIVSGMALVILLYMIVTPLAGKKLDMACLDKATSYLFYAVIVDFSLELLDFIHRLYESEESIEILSQLVTGKLFVSLVVIQVLLGMMAPLTMISLVKIFNVAPELRRMLYFLSVVLIQIGIFATRWNVVIGGQLFSKSFRGLLTHKMEMMGIEGLLVALCVLALPFFILWLLYKILPIQSPPDPGEKSAPVESAS